MTTISLEQLIRCIKDSTKEIDVIVPQDDGRVDGFGEKTISVVDADKLVDMLDMLRD